jgi:6-pyruvoyltetrahydropterin/6-carboxytetrahydropterin synthase
MHGHNWKLEVLVLAHELDEVGMGIDFKTMKRHANELAEELDHRYLNELEYFSSVNPTAENIAAWFYKQLGERLNNDRVRISEVTIWETETACVSYFEE